MKVSALFQSHSVSFQQDCTVNFTQPPKHPWQLQMTTRSRTEMKCICSKLGLNFWNCVKCKQLYLIQIIKWVTQNLINWWTQLVFCSGVFVCFHPSLSPLILWPNDRNAMCHGSKLQWTLALNHKQCWQHLCFEHYPTNNPSPLVNFQHLSILLEKVVSIAKG